MIMNNKRINFIPGDLGGCGYYRIIYPAQMLFNHYKVTISAPATFNYYEQDYIYTQRICYSDTFKSLLRMKDKGVKFIIDYDDCIWKEVPSYNRCNVHWKDNYNGMKEYLALLADKVTCTNEFIKESLTEFIEPDKIIVIPNSLDYSRWRFDYYEPNDKLNFLYAGSNTHWNVNDTGDFHTGLINYLKDKEVNIMGTNPTFLKVHSNTPWVDVNSYPIIFASRALQNRFVLAPLRDNYFNKCKSDLKYLECCAVGRVALVSTFTDSPYNLSHPLQRIPNNCSESTMKEVVKNAIKHYDEIIKHQYSIINNRWLKKDLYEPLFN